MHCETTEIALQRTATQALQQSAAHFNALQHTTELWRGNAS